MRIKGGVFFQFVAVLLLCTVLFITVLVWIGEVSFSITSGIDDIINASDRIFIEIASHCTSLSEKNENNQAYINSLGNYYNLQIIAADANGRVLVKSDNVSEEKVNLELIKNTVANTTYQGSGYFYRLYTTDHIGREPVSIIIRSVPQHKLVYSAKGDVLTGAIAGLCVFIILFYMFMRHKVKYITELSFGLREISKGNLDFRVKCRGKDELGQLGENINLMTSRLQEKIESERLAEQSKTELVTNVSHDLRAPLTSIIGYINLIKDRKYEDEDHLAHYIDVIGNKGNMMKKLIDDLFEYTTLSSCPGNLKHQKVYLDDMISQLLEEYMPVYEEKGLELDVEIPVRKIPVKADPDRLVRVFENILINAIKFSPIKGKIGVRLVTADTYALLEIRNSNEGIPQEDISKLFDRFYKVDKARQTGSGSGLGLAIAKSIVDLHEGSIWVESENGEVKFTVKLRTESVEGRVSAG